MIERTLNAPIDKVWRAITSKAGMKQWFFDVKGFKLKLGNEFQFLDEKDGRKFPHVCRIVEVVESRMFAFTWRYEGLQGESLVTFELLDVATGLTKVRLTHEGRGSFSSNGTDLSKDSFTKGWTHIIDKGLKSFVEE